MTPLLPLLLAAARLALAGGGGADALIPELDPLPGPAFDYRRGADEETLKTYHDLGYTFEPMQGYVRLTNGKIMTRPEYERDHQPVTVTDLMPEVERKVLLANGYRFDAAAERMIGKNGPLTRAQERYFRQVAVANERRDNLEKLAAGLAGADPDEPLAPAQRTRIAAQATGRALPPSLATLAADGQTNGQALAAVRRAYDEYNRMFDGAETHAQFQEVRRQAAKAPPPMAVAAVDAQGRRVSEAVAAAVIRRYQRTGAGRKMLSSFTDPDGKVRFPVFRVAVIDPRYGAAHSTWDDSITVNATQALAFLPEDERRALKPQAVAAALLERPDLLEKLVDSLDVTLYHELTHALQARRQRLDGEGRAGRLTTRVIPLENEHEAFMEAMRYFHEKLKADPTGPVDDWTLKIYRAMITNPEQFREDITRTYVRSWPQTAATLPQARDLQRQRIESERRMQGEGLSGIVHFLKRRSYERGERGIEQTRADAHAHIREFLDKDFPAMRAEGLELLLTRYRAQHGDDAVRVLEKAKLGRAYFRMPMTR